MHWFTTFLTVLFAGHAALGCCLHHGHAWEIRSQQVESVRCGARTANVDVGREKVGPRDENSPFRPLAADENSHEHGTSNPPGTPHRCQEKPCTFAQIAPTPEVARPQDGPLLSPAASPTHSTGQPHSATSRVGHCQRDGCDMDLPRRHLLLAVFLL